MSRDTVTVYVTKYALSTGITKEAGCTIENGYAGRCLGSYLSASYLFVKMGRDAFLTEAEAQQRAETMGLAKIKNLTAQKNKVSKLVAHGFPIKEGRGPK